MFEAEMHPGSFLLPRVLHVHNCMLYSLFIKELHIESRAERSGGQSVSRWMLEAALFRLVFKWGVLFWRAGHLCSRQASLWPCRTGVVHLLVKGKCPVGDCEHNYSSFASLRVRRRDPAYRSDSWNAWMPPLSDGLRDRYITGERSGCMCVCVCPKVEEVFRSCTWVSNTAIPMVSTGPVLNIVIKMNNFSRSFESEKMKRLNYYTTVESHDLFSWGCLWIWPASWGFGYTIIFI